MFHSAGFFRGVPCPFFEHGLCHRPHCHYKHSKPGSTRRAGKVPALNIKPKFHTSRPAPLENPVTPANKEGTPESVGTVSEVVDAIGQISNYFGSSVVPSAPQAECPDVVPTHNESDPSTGPTENAVSAFLHDATTKPTTGPSNPTSSAGVRVQSSGQGGSGNTAIGHLSREDIGRLAGAIAEQLTEIADKPQEERDMSPELPNYAPEKCIAKQGDGKGSQLAPPSSAVGSMEEGSDDVSKLQNLLVSEEEIFGAPLPQDEEDSDGDVGDAADPSADTADADDMADLCDMGDTFAELAENKGEDEDVAMELNSSQPLTESQMIAEFQKLTSIGEDTLKKSAESKKRGRAEELEETDIPVKKKRVAHPQAENVGVREPIRVAVKQKTVDPNFSSMVNQGDLYMGKKRVANKASSAPTVNPSRPRIPLDPRAKISTKVRQSYLDSYIDQHMKMHLPPQEAYEKAVEEEKALFTMSKDSRNSYLNKSYQTLKQLKAKVQDYLTKQREESDKRVQRSKEISTQELVKVDRKSKNVCRQGTSDAKKCKDAQRKVHEKDKSRLRTAGKDVDGWKSLSHELQATFNKSQSRTVPMAEKSSMLKAKVPPLKEHSPTTIRKISSSKPAVKTSSLFEAALSSGTVAVKTTNFYSQKQDKAHSADHKAKSVDQPGKAKLKQSDKLKTGDKSSISHDKIRTKTASDTPKTTDHVKAKPGREHEKVKSKVDAKPKSVDHEKIRSLDLDKAKVDRDKVKAKNVDCDDSRKLAECKSKHNAKGERSRPKKKRGSTEAAGDKVGSGEKKKRSSFETAGDKAGSGEEPKRRHSGTINPADWQALEAKLPKPRLSLSRCKLSEGKPKRIVYQSMVSSEADNASPSKQAVEEIELSPEMSLGQQSSEPFKPTRAKSRSLSESSNSSLFGVGKVKDPILIDLTSELFGSESSDDVLMASRPNSLPPSPPSPLSPAATTPFDEGAGDLWGDRTWLDGWPAPRSPSCILLSDEGSDDDGRGNGVSFEDALTSVPLNLKRRSSKRGKRDLSKDSGLGAVKKKGEAEGSCDSVSSSSVSQPISVASSQDSIYSLFNKVPSLKLVKAKLNRTSSTGAELDSSSAGGHRATAVSKRPPSLSDSSSPSSVSPSHNLDSPDSDDGDCFVYDPLEATTRSAQIPAASSSLVSKSPEEGSEGSSRSTSSSSSSDVSASIEERKTSSSSTAGHAPASIEGRKTSGSSTAGGSSVTSGPSGSGRRDSGPAEPPSHQPCGPYINLTRMAKQNADTFTATHAKKLASFLPKPSKKPGSKPGSKMTTSFTKSSSSSFSSSLQTVSRSSTGSSSKPKPSASKTKANFTILKKKELPPLTSELFYCQMWSYLLTEEQLQENRYPRPTAKEGVAFINLDGEVVHKVEAVGPNAVRHQCCRCRKPFIIYNDGQYQTVESCSYHYGRTFKYREYGEGVVSKYSCCQEQSGSPGCQLAKLHVTAGESQSHVSGYAATSSWSKTSPASSSRKPRPKAESVYALDCEMCYTTKGLQLARVSVVNMDLKPVYEKLVKPSHPIVDYNTRFSGLTAEDFVGVNTTLSDVQHDLLNLFSSETILVGHSLESDFKALQLLHSRVVDTAVVFPHRMGPPYKKALKTLAKDILRKFIQDSGDEGHDSLEDSRTCMELMLWKVKGDLKAMCRRSSTDK